MGLSVEMKASTSELWRLDSLVGWCGTAAASPTSNALVTRPARAKALVAEKNIFYPENVKEIFDRKGRECSLCFL